MGYLHKPVSQEELHGAFERLENLIDSEIVEMTVFEAGNQSPVLASIGSQVTTENINLNFGVSAVDIGQNRLPIPPAMMRL